MLLSLFFFFNDTATTEIYTLSLHDALPISELRRGEAGRAAPAREPALLAAPAAPRHAPVLAGLRRPRALGPLGRSEEHTSELQSRQYIVCRLLLEKKKKPIISSPRYNSTLQ